MQVQLREAQWYTHRYNRPFFYRVLAAVALVVPRPLRLWMARLVAKALRRCMPHENAAVQRNLSRVLPDANTTAIDQCATALFQNFACFFSDLISINRRSLRVQQRYVCHIHGLERLHQALAGSRGVVVATAHMGNWELAGRLLTTYGKTVHVLVAPEQHAAVQRFLRQGKPSPWLRFVSNDTSGGFMQLLMALRRGDIVAVQIDRATGHRSDVLVPFYGAPARLPLGPLILARAAQVPVLPCFCVMRPDRRYDVFVDEPLLVLPDQEEATLRRLIGVLERYVTLAPEQWCNFYDVWETE